VICELLREFKLHKDFGPHLAETRRRRRRAELSSGRGSTSSTSSSATARAAGRGAGRAALQPADRGSREDVRLAHSFTGASTTSFASDNVIDKRPLTGKKAAATYLEKPEAITPHRSTITGAVELRRV